MKLDEQQLRGRANDPGRLFLLHPRSGAPCLSRQKPEPALWPGPRRTFRQPQSFVVICHDPDVPSRGDDVNQEGRTVPATLPRIDFFHWVLIELPADTREIQAGELSNEVTPRGKGGPAAPHGARQGINDYTAWFAGDGDMRGDYFGYDGPCPPWNDEIVHRYVFTVFALDIDTLPLEGTFSGQQVRDAIKGHILAEASLTGLYALNPSVAV
jgi:Raf kinase inhibitor-like YbhB/YbcL family protein